MIVSTCSFGSTGSSAVSDYLKECDNTQVLDRFEFTIPVCTDGLSDLEYHLVKKNTRQSASITAIQRFQKMIHYRRKSWSRNTNITMEDIDRFTNEFLNSITQVKYVGLSPRIYKGGNETVNRYIGNSVIMRRIIRPLEKRGVIKKNIDVYPLGLVRMSVHPENFYSEAKRYVHNLLEGMGANFDSLIVLDQAFYGSNPTCGFNFFDDPYAIIVDRDPRDIYIFAKEVLLSRGRFMPTENVQDFITYFRVIRDGKQEDMKNERCLFLQFEEMIYDYDRVTRKIDEFLSVTNNRRKTIFDPGLSVANTNLIRKFPQYAADIAIIEKELPEFLFDFSKYPEIENNGTMFFGKSPLNRR